MALVAIGQYQTEPAHMKTSSSEYSDQEAGFEADDDSYGKLYSSSANLSRISVSWWNKKLAQLFGRISVSTSTDPLHAIEED